MSESKATADWERIENDYRAGIKSLRQIGSEYGVSHVAINKRAKRDGWERDLAAKIKAKAEAKVTKAAVTAEVTTERLVAEQAIIEANAEMQAGLILSHRSDIGRYRELARSLLLEIEAQTGSHELFVSLGEMLKAPDEKGMDKLHDLYRKVISTPSRIDSMKKLADTLKVLIWLEREAFGIDARKSVGQTLDEFLDGIALDGIAAEAS